MTKYNSNNKVIIHTGLHKTGTTYLQNEIWSQLKSYSFISRPYTQHNHAFNQMQYADDTLYNKELVEHEISKFEKKHLLLSDESFSGKPIYFSYINRSTIAKRLNKLFPDAEIILFIRDQIDIMKSHYSSYIKMPYGVKKIENLFYKPNADYNYYEYLNKQNPSLESLFYNTNDYFIHMDSFKYSSLIEMYQKLFKKCHIFLFEDLVNNQNEVLKQLSDLLGEELLLKNTVHNKSLSSNELSKKIISNKLNLIYGNKRFKNALTKIINKVSPPIPTDSNLKSNLKSMTQDYYKSDNKILKKLCPSINWDRYPNSYL